MENPKHRKIALKIINGIKDEDSISNDHYRNLILKLTKENVVLHTLAESNNLEDLKVEFFCPSWKFFVPGDRVWQLMSVMQFHAVSVKAIFKCDWLMIQLAMCIKAAIHGGITANKNKFQIAGLFKKIFLQVGYTVKAWKRMHKLGILSGLCELSYSVPMEHKKPQKYADTQSNVFNIFSVGAITCPGSVKYIYEAMAPHIDQMMGLIPDNPSPRNEDVWTYIDKSYLFIPYTLMVKDERFVPLFESSYKLTEFCKVLNPVPMEEAYFEGCGEAAETAMHIRAMFDDRNGFLKAVEGEAEDMESEDTLKQLKKEIKTQTNIRRTCSATGCEIKNDLKVCAGCKGVAYCSRTCQKSAWKSHKKMCAKLVK